MFFTLIDSSVSCSDTRIYGYSKDLDAITKLTRDHFFVGRKLDKNEIKEYEAICSDEMKTILTKVDDPEATAKALVKDAFDKGSHDNISVIIIDK